jgi:hypothetical protein
MKICGAAVAGRGITNEGLFMVILSVSFGNHRSCVMEDNGCEVIKTSGDYDASIPTWDLNQHQARGTVTGHLHFPHSRLECYESAKTMSVRAEWLSQSAHALSELSEAPFWRITPLMATLPCIALHITVRSLFHHIFSLELSHILIKYCRVEHKL